MRSEDQKGFLQTPNPFYPPLWGGRNLQKTLNAWLVAGWFCIGLLAYTVPIPSIVDHLSFRWLHRPCAPQWFQIRSRSFLFLLHHISSVRCFSSFFPFVHELVLACLPGMLTKKLPAEHQHVLFGGGKTALIEGSKKTTVPPCNWRDYRIISEKKQIEKPESWSMNYEAREKTLFKMYNFILDFGF